MTTVIETTEGKKDVESKEFQHLSGKDSLFRTLATRLQMAERIKTTQYNEIFLYLNQKFFTLDQKPIALIHLGDPTSYNWILTKLEAHPEKATELKESLFRILDKLMGLAQGPKANSSANETMLQTPQETKIDPVFSKEAEITQVNESTQPFIESITTSLEEVNATDNLNTQTNMSPTLSNRKTSPSTLFTLKEPSINSSFLFFPLDSSYTM